MNKKNNLKCNENDFFKDVQCIVLKKSRYIYIYKFC